MNVIYSSNIISSEYYDLIFDKSMTKPSIQGLKYNRLIAEGLAENGVNVFAISAIQMTRKNV